MAGAGLTAENAGNAEEDKCGVITPVPLCVLCGEGF